MADETGQRQFFFRVWLENIFYLKIFFFIFKKLFLILMYQNNLKIQNKILI
jgi:hypothetical protein